MNRPPNILLIVVDCARSDRFLGAARRVRTPHLDRLSQRSVRLPTTIVEKACTTPAFSSLLTGEYSPRHGVHLVWGYRLPADVPLLTDALAQRGYHTYAEVTGPLLPEMGLARGFEHYEYRAPCDYLHTAWGAQLIERLGRGHYRPPFFLLLHLWELHPPRCVRPEFRSEAHGASEYDRAVAALDAALEPLLAALPDETIVALTGDHGEKLRDQPYRPGTAVDYARRLLKVDQAEGLLPYQMAQWAGPSALQAFYGQATPALRSLRVRQPAALPRYSTWQRLGDRLRLLRLTPWLWLHDLLALGVPLKLTRMLRRRGLIDAQRAQPRVEALARSLGPQRLADMQLRMWINSYKHNLDEGHMLHVYESLVRVPLILYAPPRFSGGRTIERMVRQPDILPTLCELAGVPPEALPPIAGRSLVPLLAGRPWESPPAFLSVSGLPIDLELRGVRTERYKYTYGPENDELPVELYDLHDDPDETRNLAGEQPQRCHELRALAERFALASRAAVAAPPATVDEQRRVEEQLRALGYLE